MFKKKKNDIAQLKADLKQRKEEYEHLIAVLKAKQDEVDSILREVIKLKEGMTEEVKEKLKQK